MNKLHLSTPSTQQEVDENTLILKLERHQRALQQLQNKLNSYICEPKTYSLYERMEVLKWELEKLRSDNATIIANVKSHTRTMNNYVERIKNQFLEFNSMQKGVEDYIEGARNC